MIFQKGGLCMYNIKTKKWKIGKKLGRKARKYSQYEANALNLLGLTSSEERGLSKYFSDTNRIWGLNKPDFKTLSEIINEIVIYAKKDPSYDIDLQEAIGHLVAARQLREEYPPENEDEGHRKYREGINRLINLLSESQRAHGFTGHRDTRKLHRKTTRSKSRTRSRSKSKTRSRSKSKTRSRSKSRTRSRSRSKDRGKR